MEFFLMDCRSSDMGVRARRHPPILLSFFSLRSFFANRYNVSYIYLSFRCVFHLLSWQLIMTRACSVEVRVFCAHRHRRRRRVMAPLIESLLGGEIARA